VGTRFALHGTTEEKVVKEDHDESGVRRGGFVSGVWRRLSTPSARWSVLALIVVGLLFGVGGTIGTQLMVAATGTNEFCGGACHSMQWVAQEYAQSAHHTNRTGVQATCHDCHIPERYPDLLWYKARAGITTPFRKHAASFPPKRNSKKTACA
jgi:trimethylamine-N-oxide reductase cytochrome c-type subunit TorC